MRHSFRALAAVLTAVSAAAAWTPAAQAAPTAPTTTAVDAQGVVTWSDTSSSESGFVIERCSYTTECTDWARVGWVPANVTTFTDAPRPWNPPYLAYRVRSFDYSGWSEPSPAAVLSRGIGATVYISPPILTVDPTDPNLVHADGSATNPPIYTVDENGNLVPRQEPTGWNFGDGATSSTPTPVTEHVFDVGGTYAITATGRGTADALVSVPGHPVTKPTRLTASGIRRMSVRLSWVNFPTQATGYAVWRCTGTTACTTSWRRVGTVGRSATTYVAGSLRRNTAYRFALTTTSAGLPNARSDELAVRTLP